MFSSRWSKSRGHLNHESPCSLVSGATSFCETYGDQSEVSSKSTLSWGLRSVVPTELSGICVKMFPLKWRKPDESHYSQWGLLGTIGIVVERIRYFFFLFLERNKKKRKRPTAVWTSPYKLNTPFGEPIYSIYFKFLINLTHGRLAWGEYITYIFLLLTKIKYWNFFLLFLFSKRSSLQQPHGP